MKKIGLFFTICFLTFTEAFAQPCQITLTSGAGSDAQSVCLNAAVSPITYTVDPGASSAGASGLPSGVSSSFNAGTVTINGTPTGATGTYTYSVIALGSCTQAIITGSIAVIPLPTATIGGTNVVCKNEPSNITFSGGGVAGPYTITYNINGGGNLTATTVSGNTVNVAVPTNTAGAYTYSLIAVQDGTSSTCSQTQTGSATITVNPLPMATIAGSTTVCEGSSPTPDITFTGTNGTTPYTFTYNVNNGANQTATTTSGSSVAIASSTNVSGVYTYSLVQVTDANSCSQAETGSDTITVNPFGINILATNQTTLTPCNGYMEATATGIPPFTYVWSDSASVNTPYRFNVCSGSYYVIITDSAGVCKDTTYTYVDDYTTPASPSSTLNLSISSTSASSDAACDGTALVKVSGGTPPYDILFGKDTIHTPTHLISKLCLGFYTVNVYDALSNKSSFIFIVGSPSNTFNYTKYSGVTKIDTLLTSALLNCVIDYNTIDSIRITDFTLVGTDSINVTWTIYHGLGSITLTSQYAKYGNISQPGVYTLILDLYCTNRESGSVRASDEIYIDNRVGINSIDGKENVFIYPNPFNNELNIKAESGSFVSISGVRGNEIYNGTITSDHLTIDMADLKPGIYFVTISTTQTNITQKIIKY